MQSRQASSCDEHGTQGVVRTKQGQKRARQKQARVMARMLVQEKERVEQKCGCVYANHLLSGPCDEHYLTMTDVQVMILGVCPRAKYDEEWKRLTICNNSLTSWSVQYGDKHQTCMCIQAGMSSSGLQYIDQKDWKCRSNARILIHDIELVTENFKFITVNHARFIKTHQCLTCASKSFLYELQCWDALSGGAASMRIGIFTDSWVWTMDGLEEIPILGHDIAIPWNFSPTTREELHVMAWEGCPPELRTIKSWQTCPACGTRQEGSLKCKQCDATTCQNKQCQKPLLFISAIYPFKDSGYNINSHELSCPHYNAK